MIFFIAEVMDKEPSLGTIVVVGAALVLAGATLSAVRWWLGLIVAFVAVLLSAALLTELLDPQITHAIAAEAGGRYLGVAYFVVFCSVVVPAAAALQKRKGQRISSTSNRSAA